MPRSVLLLTKGLPPGVAARVARDVAGCFNPSEHSWDNAEIRALSIGADAPLVCPTGRLDLAPARGLIWPPRAAR